MAAMKGFNHQNQDLTSKSPDEPASNSALRVITVIPLTGEDYIVLYQEKPCPQRLRFKRLSGRKWYVLTKVEPRSSPTTKAMISFLSISLLSYLVFAPQVSQKGPPSEAMAHLLRWYKNLDLKTSDFPPEVGDSGYPKNQHITKIGNDRKISPNFCIIPMEKMLHIGRISQLPIQLSFQAMAVKDAAWLLPAASGIDIDVLLRKSCVDAHHGDKFPQITIEIHYSESPLNWVTRKQPNAFELGVRPSQWFTQFIGVVSNFGVPKSHGSTKNAGRIPPFRQTHRKWRVFVLWLGFFSQISLKWTGWKNLKVGHEHMVESGYPLVI